MQKKADSKVEAGLLEERILRCEHCLQLSVGNIAAMKLAHVQAHINNTREYWPKFPFVLQISIVARMAMEQLQTSVPPLPKQLPQVKRLRRTLRAVSGFRSSTVS